MFSLHGQDKAALTRRALYVMENFEPNSNYELGLTIRRSSLVHDGWKLTISLFFPHVNYKRSVRQASFYGRQKKAFIPIKNGRQRRRLPRIPDEGQKTLAVFCR